MHRIIFHSFEAQIIASLRLARRSASSSACERSLFSWWTAYNCKPSGRNFGNGSSGLYPRSGSGFTDNAGGTNNSSNKVVSNISPSHLFAPVPVQLGSTSDHINVGEEIAGKLDRNEMVKVLHEFLRRPQVKLAAEEAGLDSRLFHQSFVSFRKFVIESRVLPTELHVILSDITSGSSHVDELFPFFLDHARKCFPHLDCMEDLQQISDLTNPSNWYPEARGMHRKVIFHAGPTNSGKTYNALQRFMNSTSGLYCGPLRLLASEVFQKTNSLGHKCDLVTGEERKYASNDPEQAAKHVSCTVEMVPTTEKYEVAIIDEIQMIKDPIRGWAWTRALLGLVVDELHLCGEASAINLVRELLLYTGDEFEVCRYKRLTPLQILDKPLGSLDNIRDGDCVVCFSKNDIYAVSRQLDHRGINCGVIYGGLPPGTKLAQARDFNDPNHACNVLVATDAIGMGLNLSIKRIIFYSLIKPTTNSKGEKEMDLITTSQALQIAGRAGRYGSLYENGEVTTFRGDDLPRLRDVMSQPVDDIEQAGLHPTDEQIELFAYHLPNATLSNLIDIFSSIARTNKDLYFMCNLEDLKFLADMLQHVPLPLKVRYKFCCSPIGRRDPFVCSMLLKYARQFSRGQPLTFDWMCRYIGWPVRPPANLVDLVHLEHVFDTLDLYLWLGYRFPDMFPDQVLIRDMQQELDAIISDGVSRITKLLQNVGGPGGSAMDGSKVDNRQGGRRSGMVALATGGLSLAVEDSETKEASRKVQKKKAFTLISTGTSGKKRTSR